jgi:FtsH-binding integral membrane protein
LLQFFYPVDNVTNGIVGIITFCGYVVYDTENLIKRYKHDEYISAAIVLYLDILNLFLKLVRWKRRLLAKIEKMLDSL